MFSGADLVEVAPAYDHGETKIATGWYMLTFPAEITATAAADLIHDFLSLMTFNQSSSGR
jgi:arginase family enzyme